MRYLFAAFLFLIAPYSEAMAERRVALIIGNEQYQSAAPLANPKNDATAIAASLEGLGFEVLTGIDLDQRGMQSLIRDFSRLLIGSDVALFYYAGHGIQVSGENYLIPVDAELQDETDLEFAAVKFNLILGQMEREPRVKLLFLDACRDNPFKEQLARGMSQTRATGRVSDGLAKIDVNSAGGTLIAFATDPGALAMDGSGERNSPFTAALLDHIETPGLEIHSMMIDVRSSVWEKTRERQRPWSNSSLTGKFFFKPQIEEQPVVLAMSQHGASAPALEDTPSQPEEKAQAQQPAGQGSVLDTEIELEFWRSASDGNTVEEYEVYLEQYPSGKFAKIAQARIAKLTQNSAPSADVAADPDLGATKGLAAIDGAVASISPEEAEAALNLNRAQRRELQHRLRLAGFNPGGADGVLGPRSRQAIGDWQSANGGAPSGYMTLEQLKALGGQTDSAYQAYLADAARRQQARRQQSTTRRAASTAPQAQDEREGSHLGSAFRKIGHGFRDIFK